MQTTTNPDEKIYCYCCSTGLKLYELDDNTIAYINECDPSGVMLSRIASQQKHPALSAFRQDWGRLADCCPHVFLCFLLHKFIVIPNVQRETYAYVKAMGQVSDSIVQMYEQDIIDDKVILALLEHLTLVPVITSPHGNKPEPVLLAHLNIETHQYYITLYDIEKLEQDILANTRTMSCAQVSRCLSSYWEDNHCYIPTLAAMYGVKEKPADTVRRVVKKHTKLMLTESTLEALDFHYVHPLLAKDRADDKKALKVLNHPPAVQSRLEQMEALAVLIRKARPENNS